MKKLVGVIVILAALLVGAYYGMGFMTERTLKKNIEVINQSNGFSVKMSGYQRGLFQSTAQLSWQLDVPAHSIRNMDGQVTQVSARNYKIKMPLVIHHGPVILADSNVLFGFGYASTNISLPEDYAVEFDKLYSVDSTKPRLKLSLFVNYLNDTTLHIRVPEFKLVSKAGETQFEWLGMTSEMQVSPKFNEMSGHLAIEGVHLMKQGTKTILDKMTTQYHLNRTKDGLYFGTMDLSFPMILVMQGDQKVLELDKLKISSNSDVKQGLFNSTLSAGLDKLVSNGRTYGTSKMDFSLKNLDAHVLADINDQVAKLQQKTDADRQRALIGLLPDVLQLFSRGAEIELSELSIATPEGNVDANLLISLPSEHLNNPFQLFQKITGEGKLNISATVLKTLMTASLKEKLRTSPAADTTMLPAQGAVVADMDQQAATQADEKIAKMVQTGLLAAKGAAYLFDAKLSQGQLVINGKPFSSAMMQF